MPMRLERCGTASFSWTSNRQRRSGCIVSEAERERAWRRRFVGRQRGCPNIGVNGIGTGERLFFLIGHVFLCETAIRVCIGRMAIIGPK